MEQLGDNDSRETELFFRQDMSDIQLRRVATGVVAVASQRAPDKETPNEDAAAVIQISSESGVLVVADGAGGCQGGEIAAEIAIKAIEKAVRAAVDAPPAPVRRRREFSINV